MRMINLQNIITQILTEINCQNAVIRHASMCVLTYVLTILYKIVRQLQPHQTLSKSCTQLHLMFNDKIANNIQIFAYKWPN